MIITIDRLVNAVCPTLCEGKRVRETMDKERFYRVSNGTLYVPTVSVLRANLNELDKFSEALLAFNSTSEYTTPEDWLDKNLELILDYGDPELALDYLQQIIDNHTGYIVCDIESRRIEWEDNKVIALGFAWSNSEALAITALHDLRVVRKLQELFSSEGKLWIWHNGMFDTTRLNYLMGIRARIDEDTMYQHFIGINEKKGTHGLKDLGQLYLQAPAWEEELDSFKKEFCRVNKIRLSDFTYDQIPIEVLIPYMLRDVLATFRLFNLFNVLMRPESRFIYRKIIKAANVYAEIMLAGCEFNSEHCKILKQKLEKERQEAEQEMFSIIEKVWNVPKYCYETGARMKTGTPCNPGSPKQLKWLIKELTGKTMDSTDKKALEELSDHADEVENESGKRFIKAIGAMRKAGKYLDTYAYGFESLVCKDGRIRGSFNLHGTETGRLSSSEPNMHNIPRNPLIKNLLQAKPGYKLVQLDYSQAELRVLTALSGDPFMLSIYENGRDLHDEMATQMFGPNFTKEQRVITKSLNFGIAYGRGPASISEMFKISMAQAKQTIEDWYKPVPLVKKFIQDKRQEPFKGIPSTTPFGRMRHFIITDETQYHVQNEAINFPIQSIASDLTLLSVLDIHDELAERGLDAKIVNTVHDSIIIECIDDESVIDQVVEIGQRVMTSIPDQYLWGEGLKKLLEQTKSTTIPKQRVPFKADAEVGYIWGELEKYKKKEAS